MIALEIFFDARGRRHRLAHLAHHPTGFFLDSFPFHCVTKLLPACAPQFCHSEASDSEAEESPTRFSIKCRFSIRMRPPAAWQSRADPRMLKASAHHQPHPR